MTNEVREKVYKVILQYGSSWKTKSSRGCGSVYTSVGILVTTKMMDRLEGNFSEDEEKEFKTLFLILLLHMVLCPTQSPRLASDLIPAVSCVKDCTKYDWSELVLKKMMDSVSSFAWRFYATGYAGGYGGCAIFAVIFYLDRLNRPPLHWDVLPRIKVWSKHEIAMAAKEDRIRYGDYGRLGLVDVAYGESYYRIARDIEAPVGNVVLRDVSELVGSKTERQRRSGRQGRGKVEHGHNVTKNHIGCYRTT